MKREQIARGDFPPAGDGYDRASVDAHLAAVAAWTTALEAQTSAIEVERDALRIRLAEVGENAAEADAQRAREDAGPEPAATAAESSDPATTERPGTESAASNTDEAEHVPAGSHGADATQEDQVSARLVATRLALEGAERDQIASRLAEEYELDDPGGLVDDVLRKLS